MVKTVFLIMVIIHGLIHFMGFIKAFNLAEISQLAQTISRPMGILWLLSAFLFLGVAVLHFIDKEWWWMAGLITVVFSQILILLFWQDAKFGTIPNIIVLMAVIIGFAFWNFNLQVSRETQEVLAENVLEGKVITEETIAGLPAPVRRWLQYSGVIGKEQISSVYLKQKGLMKLEPGQKGWFNAEAQQYFSVDSPSFIWTVETSMKGVPVVGRDLFINGEGEMQIKLAGLIPVVAIANDPKLNEATLQRFLGEIVWFPSAAVNPYINWEAIDEDSAKAIMSYGDTTGSAIFHFNKQGKLTKFVAPRYKEITDDEPTGWVVTVKETGEVSGIKVPTKLEAAWLLEEGEFTWYKFEIYDLQYTGIGN